MMTWLVLPPRVLLLACLVVWQVVPSACSAGHDGDSSARAPSGKFPCRQVNATFVDCRRLGLSSIPAGIPESTEILLLSHNRLQLPDGQALAGLASLRVLNLSHNILSRFRGGSFFPSQHRLEELDLSHNQINRIPEATFAGLSRLRSLDLSAQNNGLHRRSGFPDFLRPVNGTLVTLRLDKTELASPNFGSHLSLRSLKVLSLAGNSFSRLGKGDLQALTGARLETLDLSHNPITAIDVEFFSPLGSVDSLDLTAFAAVPLQPMLLANVSKAVAATAVRSLVLRALGLTSLASSMFGSLANSTLEVLDLSSNRIAKLGNESFGSLARLEELNLYNNSIESVSPYSLSGLDNLKSLDLDTNCLTEIVPGTFQHSPSLQKLYLTNNSITALSLEGSFKGLINLEQLHLAENKLSQTFYGEEFLDLGELVYLDLSRCKVNTGHVALTDLSFRHVPKLEYLNLKKLNLKNIMSVPSPFQALSKLQFLDLSNNNMDSFPVDTFGALKSLQTLYLDHNHFDLLWVPQPHKSVSLFLKNLVSLRTLDLSFNGFRSLPEEALKDLTSLKSLHLSNNKLSAISGRAFGSLGQLEYLDLHKNLINVVNQTLLAPVLKSLKFLAICGNPFSCSCQQEWFRNWMDRTDAVLLNRSLCLCDSPPEWRNKPLTSFHPDEYICDGKLPLWAWGAIGSGSFVVLILFVVTYAKRWAIYYTYLVVRANHRRSRRRRKKDGYQELYDYDAFISYSAADAEWVTQQLVPELESRPNPFRLCYHDRDFEPGKEVVENIIRSVDRSCRTICVLSASYLESHWCTYERRITVSKLFINYRDALILVVLEDIPDQKMSKYDLIHRTIKRKTYLKWPADPEEQPVFWQKLKDVLSEDRHPENNEVLPINA